jgi:hypothetical protein
MLRLRGDRWITLKFKLADLWVGAFWDRRKTQYGTARGIVIEEFHLWVCLMPCFPIHYVAASKYSDWATSGECPGHGFAGKGEKCCDRAGESNGYYDDGPLLFVCPKHCSCHEYTHD